MPTQAEVAKHLDLSPRHVRELRDKGVIDLSAGLDAVRVAYIQHLRAASSGRGSSLSDARARREAAQAAMAEHELEVTQGRWLLAAAVDAVIEEALKNFQRTMRSMPKTAMTALGLSQTQSRKLLALVDRALHELARSLEQLDRKRSRGGKKQSRRKVRAARSGRRTA